MKFGPRWLKPLNALVLCVAIALSGCTNGNLFGGLSDRGDSGDVETLNSEADIALRQKDYGAALNLYERVLAQDPDNSVALYGAAASAVGSAGVNFGTLLSNITNQLSSGKNVNDLHSLIQESRESIVIGKSNTDPNGFLFGIDIVALGLVIGLAICRLQLIASGAADGTISPNDIDVLLNLATLCALRVALNPLNENPPLLNLLNVNGTVQLAIDTIAITAFCIAALSDAAKLLLIQTIARDVTGAYALFNRVVTLLNLTGQPIIVQLRDDIQSAAVLLFDPSGQVPSQCISIFTAIGLTLSSFTSDNTVFQPTGQACS